MKVTGSTPGTTDRARDVTGTGGSEQVGGAKERRRGSKTPAPGSEVTEKVAISGKARDTARAKELATAAPDIDETKVARLRAAIQGGSYSVDADQIADKLVDEHLGSAY